MIIWRFYGPIALAPRIFRRVLYRARPAPCSTPTGNEQWHSLTWFHLCISISVKNMQQLLQQNTTRLNHHQISVEHQAGPSATPSCGAEGLASKVAPCSFVRWSQLQTSEVQMVSASISPSGSTIPSPSPFTKTNSKTQQDLSTPKSWVRFFLRI